MIHKKDAKDWAREHMKGLWTSPMCPFTSDLKLDEAGIKINVEYMLNVKSSGLGFGFSEPWVCSHLERKRAFEVAVDAVANTLDLLRQLSLVCLIICTSWWCCGVEL